MTAEEVRNIRSLYALSQANFANLLGIHSMTLSKIECGRLKLHPFQAMIMRAMQLAAERNGEVCLIVKDNYPLEWTVEMTLAYIFVHAYYSDYLPMKAAPRHCGRRSGRAVGNTALSRNVEHSPR